MEYEAIIGLEVHAQLSTKTKAWCSCEVNTAAYENTRVCEICSAQPGSLPVPNTQAVLYALKFALAVDCEINKTCFFDRKNYFYPDLPKGYQITQFQVPLAQNGQVEILDDEGTPKKVRIERVQMEEDTGKSTHDGENSLINLNRCGTPLIEIVGRPDIRSAKEASQYLKKLHAILTYLDVCHGNLQEGNFRCDVNLSLRPKGSETFGTRTEIKNLNSFRFVEKAIESEINRQTELLNKGEKVIQQTLGFDITTQTTHTLRTKSEAHDYRYFPEPDLLPIILTDEKIQETLSRLPELPDDKKRRFVEQYQIPAYDGEVLTTDKALANYFEEAVKVYKGEPKKVSNWIMVELLRLINESGSTIEKSPVSSQELASLLNFVLDGTISGKMAKEVFEKMYDSGKTAQEVIDQMGLVQISDESAIAEVARKVIESNKEQVEQYLAGKEKLFGFFVGAVMKQTKGQANPQKTNEILQKLLSELKK